MNKFTKLILTSAIVVTSGFALLEINNKTYSIINEGTELRIQGEVTSNHTVTVNGKLNIEGKSLQNNNIMTYGTDGSLK